LPANGNRSGERIHLARSVERSIRMATSRKPVTQMTDEEKTRALLVDELTGLGSRRAWDDRDPMPVQVMLDVEGLKWINDNVGWQAGDQLLRVVGAAIANAGVRGYRLGGDEFVFEGSDHLSVAAALAAIRRRLDDTSIEVAGRDGSRRRLRGLRVHCGLGESFEEAAEALRRAKRAGVASGERAPRGQRPRGWAPLSDGSAPPATAPGLAARLASAFLAAGRFLGQADGRTSRFYLQALREADPAFGVNRPGGEKHLSLEWLVRDARRT
jgi:diguanylate cyclase (GGDEF)-like protein